MLVNDFLVETENNDPSRSTEGGIEIENLGVLSASPVCSKYLPYSENDRLLLDDDRCSCESLPALSICS